MAFGTIRSVILSNKYMSPALCHGGAPCQGLVFGMCLVTLLSTMSKPRVSCAQETSQYEGTSNHDGDVDMRGGFHRRRERRSG